MLELVRVAKVYGVKVVFKDVSCALAAGSVSLLVGGNGAGKSTLMRIMAGLSRPSAGAANVTDQARVGYLGHATFLYPGLTAVENLAFSRGMAQRLNLARVLMQAPDVLLLDEPGTGLDAASLALLRCEITAARGRGACVVLISHDLAGDAPLADRLLALEHRKLAYDGPPAGFGGFAPVETPAGTAAEASGHRQGGPACCA